MTIQVSQELIDRALNTAEIRSAAEEASIPLESLPPKLEGKEQTILESAAKEIDTYQRLDERVQKAANKRQAAEEQVRASFDRRAQEVHQAQEELEKWVPQDRSEPMLLRYFRYLLVTSAALVTVLMGLCALLGFGAFLGFHLGWFTVREWFTAPIIMLLATVFIGCIIGIRILSAYETRPERSYDGKFQEARRKQLGLAREIAQAILDYRKENPEPAELGAARAELKAARKAADEAIIQNGIVPELRAEINALLTPSHDSVLSVSEAGGLAEVPNPKYEIDTEAKTKLGRLFEAMPGGSIGIAGPRGAGKSTLLRVFCEMPPTQMKQRKVLSVMTSAPVEYVAREFILHVFALVCQRVLLLY